MVCPTQISIRISRKSDRLIHKININKRYTCTYTTKGILSTNSNYKTSRTPVPTHGKTFKSMEEKIKGKEEQGSCDNRTTQNIDKMHVMLNKSGKSKDAIICGILNYRGYKLLAQLENKLYSMQHQQSNHLL